MGCARRHGRVRLPAGGAQMGQPTNPLSRIHARRRATAFDSSDLNRRQTMNGDFSQWRRFDPTENFTAVLHQQGRVLLDQDWNDQARIVDHWVRRGHAWADGLLVYLGGDPSATISRVATYLEPPIQDPVPDVSSITAGVRDAVVLEVSREAFNGFQWPDRLIEPALGGPDTTERVHTNVAFRLLRLGQGEDCH